MGRERVGFTMKLNRGQAAEYKRRHDAIWPELANLLKESGVSNYSIWLDEPSNTLFAYLERSRDHKMDALPSHEIMKRWWKAMADIMATNPDNSPIVTPLTEMFYMA